MASDKFYLKWNDFKANISQSFGELREDENFSGVTLACEGKHKMYAHRIILSASIPIFREILKENKHPHPLIFMRGIKVKFLSFVLDFIYYGEIRYSNNVILGVIEGNL